VAESFTPWHVGQHPGDPAFNIASQGGPQPVWRDYYDFRRSGWRSTPEAQYPDGYLGTIHTRREDRLLNSLKQRQMQRPYSRGIHKGDRRDVNDYFWPPEFNLWTGLEHQAAGIKFAPPGLGQEWADSHMVNSARRGLRGLPSQAPPSSVGVRERNLSLVRLAPPYGTPGMVVAPFGGPAGP